MSFRWKHKISDSKILPIKITATTLQVGDRWHDWWHKDGKCNVIWWKLRGKKRWKLYELSA